MVKVGSEFIELGVFFMFKREKEENTRVFIPVIARSAGEKGGATKQSPNDKQ